MAPLRSKSKVERGELYTGGGKEAGHLHSHNNLISGGGVIPFVATSGLKTDSGIHPTPVLVVSTESCESGPSFHQLTYGFTYLALYPSRCELHSAAIQWPPVPATPQDNHGTSTPSPKAADRRRQVPPLRPLHPIPPRHPPRPTPRQTLLHRPQRRAGSREDDARVGAARDVASAGARDVGLQHR